MNRAQFYDEFMCELEKFSIDLSTVFCDVLAADVCFYHLRKSFFRLLFLTLCLFAFTLTCFFCDRGISPRLNSCKLCTGVIIHSVEISSIIDSKLILEHFPFPTEFLKISSKDCIFLLVCYQLWSKGQRFDEFFGIYSGRYLEFVRDPFNFYKRYLEIVERVLMNGLLGEIFPFILSSFVQKLSAANKKDLDTVFCSEAA